MKFYLCIFALLLSTLCAAQNSSFDGLKNHLDGTSNLRPGFFTVFVGLDVNFADGRLQSYLQEYQKLSVVDASVIFTKEKISMRYIPRVNSGKDKHMTVTCYLQNSKITPCYYPTSDSTCNVIKKVEIIGTCELVVNFFIDYWNKKMEVGGYKKGEIANYQYLGDYVVLSGTDKPDMCKITISKGNIGFNYYTTFNITKE